MSAACWRPLGPACVLADPDKGLVTTGDFLCLAFDPRDTTGRTLYAGAAAGGVWKSPDNGVSWTPIGDQLPALAVGALAVGRTLDGTALVVGTGKPDGP